MSSHTPAAQTRKHSSIWAYNARILIGNTYWLIVAPIAATQIVLFWSMATAVAVSAPRAAQTIELLAPILCAFLCSHALAPEERGVGELVFVRPVSIEKVLLLRLCIIFAFVLAVLAPVFSVFTAKAPAFSPGLTILAAVPSVLALSVLAMTVASLMRNPMLGFAAAGVFWALDVLVGGYFNPLVTLHGYAGFLAGREMSELWKLNKGILVLIAGLLYVWHRRILTRPPAPRRWTAAVRAGAAIVLLLVTYVASGAVLKVTYGMRHEHELKHRTRMWYQQQFRGYGPIPVAWMFGPAFVQYVQAELDRDRPLAERGEGLLTQVDIASMSRIVERYPHSAWADNAQFEIATHAGRQQLREPWILLASGQRGERLATILIGDDIESAAREYQLLAKRYPGSPLAPVALEEQAAIGLRLLDFETARGAYEQLIADYPDAPESCEAGLALAVLYLRSGTPEGALRAADVAARAAPWDRKAQALVLSGRAAHRAGDSTAARERYQRALSAARDTIERSTRGDKTPSRIPKAEVFTTNNAVIAEAESALAGRMRPLPRPLTTGHVRGRVLVDGVTARPVRVALGARPSAEGLPSPFAEGPGVTGEVEHDGSFDLPAVPSGRYDVIACALRGPHGAPRWQLSGPVPPIDIAQGEFELPLLTVTPRPPEETGPALSPAPAGPSRRGGARRLRPGTRPQREPGARGDRRRAG